MLPTSRSANFRIRTLAKFQHAIPSVMALSKLSRSAVCLLSEQNQCPIRHIMSGVYPRARALLQFARRGSGHESRARRQNIPLPIPRLCNCAHIQEAPGRERANVGPVVCPETEPPPPVGCVPLSVPRSDEISDGVHPAQKVKPETFISAVTICVSRCLICSKIAGG